MNIKIIVPVEDDMGLSAQLAEHFGRAPFYALISLDENKQITNVETIKNMGEHL